MPFDTETPLEVQVENLEIPFQAGQQIISLDLRLLMGRHWLKMLKKNGFTLKSEYVSTYGFSAPDPETEADAQICAHMEVWQQFAAVTSRSLDGYRLYEDFKAGIDQVNRNCRTW